jgi:hypothetical protein
MSRAEGPAVKNGDRIDAGDIAEALTRAPFTYTDGATQVFTRDGRTTYTENGSPTSGKWGVDDQGQFWSFWPPTYRATYDVFWITDADGDVVGIRFTELNRGATSEGRYTPTLTSSPG